MATTNLNIRIDRDVKEQAYDIFNELGLNMTSAVNIFLRTSIRERGIPFELKLDIPNDTTRATIEEGKRLMTDPSAPKYSRMADEIRWYGRERKKLVFEGGVPMKESDLQFDSSCHVLYSKP